VIPGSSLRRAMVVSVVLHALAAAVASQALAPSRSASSERVDIEIAPPVPLPEALPPEIQTPPAPPRPERERPDEPEPASTAPHEAEPTGATIDAGVDAARPDAARPDAARPDAARPDAARDAGLDARDAAVDADLDAGVPEAIAVAAGESDAEPGDAGAAVTAADRGDAGPEVAVASTDDAARNAAPDAGAAEVALGEPAGAANSAAAGSAGSGSAGSGSAGSGSAGSGSAGSGSAGSGSGSAGSGSAGSGSAGSGSAAAGATVGATTGSGAALDTAALAQALAAAGSGAAGAPGLGDEVAVDGAPTTAGTAANLISYFPDGHVITALIRFDRLRSTEWAAQTERLLRPMPDYQLLFGARDADITGKLETLVISTPRPRDAAATALVARTELSRPALRDALGQGSPVTWSAARGGLLGRRTGKRFAGDERVFLSPFPGWFLLAQPGDLGGLTAPARGKIDLAIATGALPPWLAGIRGIEHEAGDARGPALIVTVALGGKRLQLGAYAIGVGVSSLPVPDRISLAAELVPQGWLVRGNLRFATDADAGEFVASVQHIQHSVADSRAIQLLLGKPIARVIAALAFARNGPRVSYATSISIADARAILAFAAQQIDDYFTRAAAGSPAGRSAPPPGAPPAH
jgi:hypothetical protein